MRIVMVSNICQITLSCWILFGGVQVWSLSSSTEMQGRRHLQQDFQDQERYISFGDTTDCTSKSGDCEGNNAEKTILRRIEEFDQQVQEYIRSKEEVVGVLVTEAEFAFRRRTNLIADCSCVPNRCSNILGPDAQCGIELGNSPRCGTIQGTMFSTDRGMAGISLPNEFPNNLTNGLKASICLMNHLEDEVVPELKTRNITTWAYIATEQGAIWTYPGRIRFRDGTNSDMEQWNYCIPYDPRIRPQYHEGATGPLDVVLLVDISDSMHDIVSGSQSRWDIVKASLIKFVDTMTFTDSFNIVFFNNVEGGIKLWDGLLPGDSENRKKAKDILINSDANNIIPFAGTNFEYAFDSAFEALQTAIDNGNSTSCEKVILFLTDGKDNYVQRNKNRTRDLINQVSNLQDELQIQSGKRARIFSFSIGQFADDAIGRQLACMHNGSWAQINAEDDPLTVFNMFLKFTATARNTSRIYWSEVYEDASGLGKTISAVTPVYTPRNDINIQGALFGIAAHDILVKDIELLAGDQTQNLIQVLQNDSQTCDEIIINSCMQQVLRGQEAECPDLSYQTSTCTKFNSKYYQKSEDMVTWAEAQEQCQNLGGNLSLPTDLKEQAFLAGQANFEGSWIGLFYNQSQWVREDSSYFDFYNQEQLFWAPREGKTLGRLCATIAPSGTTKNVYMHSYREEFTYICEFEELPESCDGQVVDVGDVEYEYSMPRVEQCSSAESLESVRFFDIVELPDIQAEDLFCYDDFSQPSLTQNFEDLLCCPSK